MRYCPYCQRDVKPKKNINWFILILMCIATGGLWLIIYIPYYFLFKGVCCPICNSDL